jgi:hypothetical protein
MNKVPCVPMVGADVEAFVYNSGNGNYIPCVGVLPGTKDKPSPLKGLPDGFAVQEDNVMAEFNIPPCTSAGEFETNIALARTRVEAMLPAKHLLSFTPWFTFRPIDLLSPQAKTIGCDPDFNAYTGGEERRNPPPLNLTRGAGGHIHLGGDFQCPDFVAALFAEAFIGLCVPVVKPKATDKRADWYGRPGIYRPKPYGIEYRTPSCLWADTAELSNFIGDWALRCARWLTETESVKIQSAFRRINWLELSEYMGAKTKDPDDLRRINLVIQVRNAGVPL